MSIQIERETGDHNTLQVPNPLIGPNRKSLNWTAWYHESPTHCDGARCSKKRKRTCANRGITPEYLGTKLLPWVMRMGCVNFVIAWNGAEVFLLQIRNTTATTQCVGSYYFNWQLHYCSGVWSARQSIKPHGFIFKKPFASNENRNWRFSVDRFLLSSTRSYISKTNQYILGFTEDCEAWNEKVHGNVCFYFLTWFSPTEAGSCKMW